jgi:ribonucleotide monophosphatase NagD (HAD superfamily)
VLSPLLQRYDHVLLDLDGCVRIGREPTARATEAIDALRAAGKGIAFVTNDSALTPEDLVRALWSMGMRASLEEVVTVGAAIQFALASRADWRTAFVVYDAERATLVFYRVEYDLAKAQQKIGSAGLPQYLAARLSVGR